MAIGLEQIGNLIKRAREDAGMTQSDLADAIGLTNGAQSISRYERAQTEVPMKRLRRIADATGKQISFFIQEPDKRDDPEWLGPLREQLEDGVARFLKVVADLEAEAKPVRPARRRPAR